MDQVYCQKRTENEWKVNDAKRYGTQHNASANDHGHLITRRTNETTVQLEMNGTITIKPFSLYDFVQHYFGMSWIYLEGNWGELGHGPTYPYALGPN